MEEEMTIDKYKVSTEGGGCGQEHA